MYSKNNKYMQEQKSANRAQRFSLRKLSIGTVSVLLGTLMFFSNGQVSADTTTGTDTSADTASVNSAANDTSASAVTLSSTDSSAVSDANSSAAASSAATTDASSAASTAATANSQAASDDAASAEGKITDEAKAKGLTDSDVSPVMSDPNGASLVVNNSNIPSGYKADPTEGRYTFGILSLGPISDAGLTSYNQTYGVNYYIRLSTAAKATNGVYDDTVYIQLVDADQDKVIWETTAKPGDVKKTIDVLKPTSGNPFQYSYVENTVNGVTSKTIKFDASPNDVANGRMYSTAVYQLGKNSQISGTAIVFDYPSPSTIETRYIAKDAAGNETILATYDETGRPGSTYTASGLRDLLAMT